MGLFLRRFRLNFWRVSLVAVVLAVLFMPSYRRFVRAGDTVFMVSLNGQQVGVLASREDAWACLRQARRTLAAGNRELTLAQAEMTFTGQDLLWGNVDAAADVTERMTQILSQSGVETLSRGYTVKINKFSVNLASREEVETLLDTALSMFDESGEYQVSLVQDTTREVNVLTTKVECMTENPWRARNRSGFLLAGVDAEVDRLMREAAPITYGDSIEDYKLGLLSMDFREKVEVVEGYLPAGAFTDLQTAIEDTTGYKETNEIYEVKAGDTLGEIAEAYDLTLQELIARNEILEDEHSMIRPGDELIVMVPRPELSVVTTQQEYYEEDYEAPVQYVDNDSWYTTKTVTLQEPSTGHRRVVAQVTCVNGMEQKRDIVLEEVTYPAVAKIVERGTIVPPSYIKPISGGRLTSGFGRRSRPTRGASSYHKGVDWATPVGTAVVASNGGVVTRAGWGKGYGYCVYIHHADGRDTRYGHLSKVLVKVGQTVSQGQKIALSGNTGVSTGPHLHFEILIGGVQVNPLKYLN
ncbi:MAG: peptidoglycan DD-metalloendopeptidase family protein [Butyrivibrio sp.]|nr:peptidoglycan DD-metalloendopeptidase family protein [Butyrivibrio sp.]